MQIKAVDERASLSAGLTQAEAAARLAVEGPNELASAAERNTAAILLDVLREPMFLLLVAAASIYLILGDTQEALMLGGSVVIIIGITVYQERKTERALEALRDLSSPRALVVRDGVQVRIPGRDVVRGDVLVLTEGDRVAADGVLTSCNDLSVDESLLTGESVPVRKAPADGVPPTVAPPGGDDLPFVYSGTLVVQGRGVAHVTATGMATEMGRIGTALEALEMEEPLLVRASRRVVRAIAIVGLLVCAIVVVGYGLTRGDWLQAVLLGVTIAMSLLPEEIPVVLTVFLALGAWRISQRQVLTRRAPAIETLGSTTVLCVDKTGTLTQNRMAVAALSDGRQVYRVPSGADQPVPQGLEEVVEYGILASEEDPFDPMERAITDLGKRVALEGRPSRDGWRLIQEYSLSPVLPAMSHVWTTGTATAHVVAAKGAPEAIARLCRLGKIETERLLAQVVDLSNDGLRVLGVAKARFTGEAWPTAQTGFDFSLVGLVGLADPIRPAVPAALDECRRAGIRVVMITGDYPGTASAIGREIGLPADDIVLGPDLDRMEADELQRRVRTADIFARVVPEQKLRLVNAYKANGEIVAMTGDGVNDAPALKASHIGIAMGARGTDVAREASAVVLLDDDFASIVAAIRLGRRIFDNLKKATAYIVAVHVPIAGVALVPILTQGPLILMPLHIVFLELIIDPICSIAFEAEPEEADVMSRPPRDPQEPLFSRQALTRALVQGAGMLVLLMAVYGVALDQGRAETEARALTFATLILSNLGLIFASRSWSRPTVGTLRSPNRALWFVTLTALAFLVAVLYVPILQDAFHLAPLGPAAWVVCLGATLAGILWFDTVKLVNRLIVSHPTR